MTTKPKDFIKRIRECKTAEEERSIINKECAEIRNLPRVFILNLNKELGDQLKSSNIAKCIFIQMMGNHNKH